MLLTDIAQVIRSKNAGPRRLTLDVMFATEADYEKVAQSEALSRATVARLYAVPEGDIDIIHYPLGRAIKISLPRRTTAGDPGDRDVYGAQQHGPLMRIEL